MAKIRIYELARELNMQNKALLQKLRSLDIPVKSHMSSLDDETATRMKASLFGKTTEQIVETRVRSTIIRRRTKPVQEKKSPEESKSIEKPVPEQEDKLTTEIKSVEETPESEVSPDPLPKKRPSKRKKTKADAPAKIISTPEPPSEPEPPMPDVISTEEPPVKKTERDQLEESVPTPTTTNKPANRTIKTPKPAKAKISKKKRKKNKKLKKEMPAKIIKMGEGPPPLPEGKAKKPSRPARQSQKTLKKGADANHKKTNRDDLSRPNKASSQEPAKDAKKKFSKAKGKLESTDKKFFKKKISFRKKAVVEGKDLYGGRKKSRKTRKWQKGKAAIKGQKTQITVAKAIKRRIKIDDAIMLSDLAKRMGIKANEMIKTLMNMGVMATVNQTIDFDTAVLVAAEFDYEVEKASFEEENILKVDEDDPDKLVPRSPVVTIMGHVDHGKTTLLDTIRQSKITDGEAGGITQHIGAYLVDSPSESFKGQIVFLDTPGHEAFTEMRYRGASVTDIVVLIVAADDGVMPQTVEAINHAKAADVPIIAVINKIDKPDAQPERVQRELAEAGLTPEDWGGDTIFVQVSAKQGKGVDTLLEMILLQAELAELKANPDKLAHGHVIEAKLDAGRGPVATVLVQNGTLRTGQPVVCGIHYGKIRALLNDAGVTIQSAGPSTPVEIIGLAGVPNAGDELLTLDDEKNARQVSAHRIQKQRAKELASSGLVSLDNLFDRIKDEDVKELNIILKADVQGSIEALRDALLKLSNEEVKVNIIHSATGAIIESDISLGAVSDAVIIGFNVRPNPKVQALATEENVEIRSYNVIYNVIQEVQSAIVGMMASVFNEHVLGRAEIRDVFYIPKIGAIAGCIVSDGKIQRGQQVRLLRNDIVIYEGKISSLRRFKDDVKEVQHGYECGIGIEKYNDIKIGDAIECYYIEEVMPELET